MRLLLLSILVITLTSCATIFTGSKQVVHFDSHTQGAKVFINNKEIGTTPFTCRLKRKSTKQNIKFKKDGYDDYNTTLTSEFKPIALLSTLYIPIDLLTGAAFKYKESYLNPTFGKTSGNKKGLFYILKNSGDTIFCRPEMYTQNKFLIYKDFNNKKCKLSWDKISEYYCIDEYRSKKGFGFLQVNLKNDFAIDKFFVVPIDSTKRKIIVEPMREIVKTKDYRILVTLKTTSTYNASTGAGTTSTHSLFYLYKGKTKQEQIKNKNCLAIVKKHFQNKPELIKMLEDKPKVKVFKKYYYDVRDPYMN